jgi:hypothetical protein
MFVRFLCVAVFQPNASLLRELSFSKTRNKNVISSLGSMKNRIYLHSLVPLHYKPKM